MARSRAAGRRVSGQKGCGRGTLGKHVTRKCLRKLSSCRSRTMRRHQGYYIIIDKEAAGGGNAKHCRRKECRGGGSQQKNNLDMDNAEQGGNIMSKIIENALEIIGNTPMMRLSRYSEESGLRAELLAKLEYLNPAGSVKDRVGLAMIEDAERKRTFETGSGYYRADFRKYGDRFGDGCCG